MKELFILVIILNLLFIIFYFIISLISNKAILNVDIPEEILKQIDKLQLKTKVEILEKVKPNYDLETDTIEINKGNNIKTLSEAFHELGHSFYNHFYNYKVYDCKNKIIEYEYKDIDLDFKFGSLLGFLFTKAIILGLLFSLFGIVLEIKILAYIGIVFAGISTILHIVNLIEEIKATKIAKQIIKNEKLISKKEYKMLTLCLGNALYTYIFITLLSISIIVIDILFLLGIFFNIY